MHQGLRITTTVLGMLVLACLCGTAAAASLGTEWKERPYSDGPFSGVKFTTNGSYVYAGGEQLMVRAWEGQKKWGGKAGTYAAMSEDGGYVVQGVGQSIILLDRTMVEQWTRNMDGQVKALAIAKNASFVITADDKGNYNSWAWNGDFIGRAKDDVVKKIALSPTENIIVATTEAGLRVYSPTLVPIWSDNKTSSLDNYILIAQDGKTIITAGANRLSSRTSTGAVNWVVNPTKNEIIDMACNYDCSVIILGSQDGTLLAVDRYGKTRWTYDAGQWVNAVAVSPDATVIAAGGLDGTVFLFDRAGRLTTQKKMDSNIRPRSLAISRDGTRIAVADQNQLYGLSVLGDADPGVMETFTPAPLDPVKDRGTKETVTPSLTTIIPTTTEVIVITPVPPTPTQQSGVSLIPILGAWALVAVALGILRK